MLIFQSLPAKLAGVKMLKLLNFHSLFKLRSSWFEFLLSSLFFLLRQQTIEVNLHSDSYNYCHQQTEDEREKLPPKHKALCMVYGIKQEFGYSQNLILFARALRWRFINSSSQFVGADCSIVCTHTKVATLMGRVRTNCDVTINSAGDDRAAIRLTDTD